ncbi:MAG: minor capsid protein [Desulfuromonadales bacterium]|nr:minor capsid protein [Desulfuromonadales bacterium]
MALSSNPTRTRTIEKNWNREINRRWKAITLSAVRQLRLMNTADMLINKDHPAGFPFVLSPSRQRTYMVFLQAEIDRLLLETKTAPNWQARYQLQSYQRGLSDARAALTSQGDGITPTEVERLAAGGLRPFTATPSLGASIGGSPIHQEGLAFLYERSYDSLKGWTDKLARETSQILFDGFEQGRGVEEIARNMVNRMNVSRSRARTIARTEVNQAYSRSSIAEARRASEEIGKEVKLRWLTVRDGKVRHSHAAVHGIVMTPERAARIKSSDGVNCRCGLAPVIPRADTAKKRLKFKQEREQMLILERR